MMMAARARAANPGRQSLELSTFDAYTTTKRTPLTYSANAEHPTNVSRTKFDGAVSVDKCSQDCLGLVTAW